MEDKMVCKAQYHSKYEKNKRNREKMYREALFKKDVECSCTLCGEKFMAESRFHLFCYFCKTSGRVEANSTYCEGYAVLL
jgi:5-methylcytosine-specific restriction endonuclease McrA